MGRQAVKEVVFVSDKVEIVDYSILDVSFNVAEQTHGDPPLLVGRLKFVHPHVDDAHAPVD